MSELVLVKKPQIYRRKDGRDPRQGEKVVGIAAQGAKTIIEHGYRPTGREDEEALNLNDHAAARLVEFYERCRVARPEDRPFYNCQLFAWFLTGSVTELQRYDSYTSDSRIPVGSANLEPGEIYAVETAEGSLNHSIVGIERPDHNLSVLGDYLCMAVTKNVDIIALYEGAAIKQAKPISASFNV